MNKKATTTPSGTSASHATKRKALGLLLLFAAAGLGLVYLQAYSRRAWEPPQPVPFNHDTHTRADLVAMPCRGCHPGADYGAQAGLPAASTCLDCHRHILAQDARLLPLRVAADAGSPLYTGEPLRWLRAQPLPAYVHFHHAAHTKKHDCERCHATPGKERPMRMQDCLECHRNEEQLPTDCTMCHS